jgi:uncharacterized protein
MDRITFDTDDGITLEGEVRLPEGSPRAPAIICHPHPLDGGSKDHPLLWAIRNELAGRGFAVLSFNFRGVMGSEGDYGGGAAEIQDVRAAIGRALREAAHRAFVAGWSFGAHVALREAMDEDRVEALALVGLPLSESASALPALPPRDRLRAYDRPVLLLAGEADPFCPVPELKALSRKLPRATVEIVKGTDHFFWRREQEAARVIGAFADSSLEEDA